MATYIKPNAIKDASIEGIKIKDNSISSSKIDGTVASKSYVDAQVKTVDDKTVALEARVTNAVQITYSELKSLRDSGKLIPGTQYRITDYTCTTAQEYTRSAGHQFDIIVTADDESTLNEEARAALHTGDEYFSGCNLNAWQIWYCLDNNTTKFAWADATNGKGVIYRMIDEFNNDCPYDFKNIIYIVKPYFIYNQWGSNYQFNRDSAIDMNIDGTQYYGYITETSPSAWSDNKCWIKEDAPTTTSTLYTNNGSTINHGGSIKTVKLDNYETYTFGRETDLSKSGNCYNNIILPYYKSDTLTLNKIIFKSDCYNNTFRDSCYNNILDSNCYNNTFGSNCNFNTFGSNYYSNTFGNYGSFNTFGSNYYSNTFGNYCNSNIFGNGCRGNTFGNSCRDNTFGDYCQYNTFGNDCYSNIFGNSYGYNTFGNGCYSNTFGNDCYNNTFGNSCYSNTFGNSFKANTFGNNCYSNTFGNDCQESQFRDGVQYFSITTQQMTTSPTSSYLKNYIRWLIVENGVRYVNAYVTGSTSSSSQCQNVRICLGIQGVDPNNRKTFDITSCINSKLNNVYQPENSQTTSV